MRMIDLDVPEYFVNRIGKVEKIGGNCIRLTMCIQCGDLLTPKYTCIWPIECLLSRAELVAMAGQEVLGELTAH